MSRHCCFLYRQVLLGEYFLCRYASAVMCCECRTFLDLTVNERCCCGRAKRSAGSCCSTRTWVSSSGGVFGGNKFRAPSSSICFSCRACAGSALTTTSAAVCLSRRSCDFLKERGHKSCRAGSKPHWLEAAQGDAELALKPMLALTSLGQFGQVSH